MKHNLVYEYCLIQIQLAYDHTRRGKKGKFERLEKLSDRLVKQGLLTQEEAIELLTY